MLLQYKDRRCITPAECMRFTYQSGNETIPFKATGTDNKCLAECPPGKRVNPKDPSSCQRCDGDHCPKLCPPGEIHNAQQAQLFKGCNVILGNLHIEVRQTGEFTLFPFLLNRDILYISNPSREE
jgi:hypothetical protein